MTSLSSTNGAEADWGSLQLLRKLYGALAHEFSIELSSCSELENAEEDGSPEARAAAQAWFAEADERIAVHQLRQFLQTSRLADETSLRAALAYALHKAEHTDADRDKTDFLLVQFFSVCAPSLLEDNDVTFAFVGETLESVLGSSKLIPFESLQGLDDVIRTAGACQTLQSLFSSGVIEKGRQLKLGAADNYFESAALVAFTRFNFLLRRCFFRTMHRDLNAILDGLRALELTGVKTLDCRGAELSGEEPVGRLRMICQSWKAMFQAEYSYGQPLRMLVDLRAAVDGALAANGEQSRLVTASEAPGKEVTTDQTSPDEAMVQEPDTPLRARAAAASGETSGETVSGAALPNDNDNDNDNESGSGQDSDL
jgi:hypothetical protein